MIKNYIENANFEDTGFAYTLSLISGKHKMVILYCLMEFETVRFNELKVVITQMKTNAKSLNTTSLLTLCDFGRSRSNISRLGSFAHSLFFNFTI